MDRPVTLLNSAVQWTQWSQAEAERIVETAVSASLEGSAEWDALLQQADVEPLAPEQRQRHATMGPPRSSGPPPIEVRRALEAVRRRATEAAAQLDAAQAGLDSATQRALDELRRCADQLVDAQLRRYISRVRPKITTASIFANAMATSRNMTAAGVKAGASTLSCDCCGAPRMKDAATAVCEFCGSEGSWTKS